MSKQNAIILCRISDQKQDDGYSLDAQERVGVEYCKNKNFNVLKIFRLIETGSKSGQRHKFDNMMEFLKEQIGKQKTSQPVCLIVEKPDRLTRNFTNREQIQFFVMMGKLEIHYYKDRRVMDKNCSPADIFTDDMMTSVSKYIALNIAREVKKGMGEKARSGWYPARPPMGYKYIRDGVVGKHGRKEARIVIDEETKNIVYRIFELRAVHKYSYGAIGEIIREEFSLSKQVQYKFNKSSIEKVLLHPFYGGTYEWQGVVYQGKHETFIPLSWVEIAQGKMRGKSHSLVHHGVFSNILKCGVPDCGCHIVYDPKTKINKTTGASREYHYYHCSDGKGVHKRMGMRQVNIPENQIWDQFGNVVKDFSIPETVAKIISTQLYETERKSMEQLRQNYFEQKEKLELMIKRQDRLYDDLTKGLIDEDDFRRMRDTLKAEIQTQRLKLENGIEQTHELQQKNAKSTLELATNAESLWNSATSDDKLVLLKNSLSNFSLEGSTVRYSLKKSFMALAQIKLNGTEKNWCTREDLNL